MSDQSKKFRYSTWFGQEVVRVSPTPLLALQRVMKTSETYGQIF